MFVNAIYEPPQSGTPDSLQLERGTQEEARADMIAAHLGCAGRRVANAAAAAAA